MGIRNTSYYAWQTAFLPLEVSSSSNVYPRVLSQFNDIAVDSSGNVYVCGYEQRQSATSFLGFLFGGATNNSWIVKKFSPKTNTFQDVDFLPAGEANAICVDANNNVYVCGFGVSGSNTIWTVRGSSTGQSGSFVNVDFLSSSVFAGSPAQSIYANPILNASGTYDVYVGGYLVNNNVGSLFLTLRKSSTPLISGTFFTIDNGVGPIEFGGDAFYNGIVSDTSGAVYVCGSYLTGVAAGASVSYWIVRSSSLGSSGTFGTIDSVFSGSADCVAIDVNNNLYVGGTSGSVSGGFTIRKSSTRHSASFSTIDSYKYTPGFFLPDAAVGLAVDNSPLNVVYGVGSVYDLSLSSDLYIVRTGVTGSSGSFVNVDIVPLVTYGLNPSAITIDRNNNVYVCGETPNLFGQGFIRYGKLTSNSASLGSTMLATSFGYTVSELSGVMTQAYKLNNVSEFPHGFGLFQMRNMVLGTRSSGTIGIDDSALVQVTHVGSTVQIMWPSQVGSFTNVQGFGDLSPGQSAGNLTTTFIPGDVFPVSGSFDQVSLYCYLLKQISGTLDTVAIEVQRRPITGLPFTNAEQVITYTASSSFVTQGALTDLVYTKPIDYGDLSISQIGYPIDVDLVNTKEVRISARQVNGQSDPRNTNLIVYGRFIKKHKGEV